MMTDYRQCIQRYLSEKGKEPLFLPGDCLHSLALIPDRSIDCIVTSPPYWGHRQYSGGGIGLESTHNEYMENLAKITKELFRVLKETGSFWLNIGDTYRNKKLTGIPWRVAIKLMDDQKWVLRNSVIWNKHKGGLDSSKDKLRNIHENIFHFVRNEKKYFYDTSNIRYDARKPIVRNGSVISATGVSGIRYKRQIELSTALTDEEKQNASNALHLVIERIRNNEIADFRMIIRGQHIPIPKKCREGRKNWHKRVFTFCSTIQTALCPAMFGKSSPKIRKSEKITTPCIRRIYAKYRFWQLARKTGLSSTRSQEAERHLWWPSNTTENRSGWTFRKSTSHFQGSD